jgi:hypothetical protein
MYGTNDACYKAGQINIPAGIWFVSAPSLNVPQVVLHNFENVGLRK